MAKFRGRDIEHVRSPRGAVRAVAGQVVVRLTPGARRHPERLESLLHELAPQSTVASPVDRLGIALVNVAPGTDTAVLIARLRADEAIESAEPHLVESGS